MQNARKSLRLGKETRLQEITRRRKIMVRKDTFFFVAISLENFNIANFYKASINTRLLEKDHVERYLCLSSKFFVSDRN